MYQLYRLPTKCLYTNTRLLCAFSIYNVLLVVTSYLASSSGWTKLFQNLANRTISSDLVLDKPRQQCELSCLHNGQLWFESCNRTATQVMTGMHFLSSTTISKLFLAVPVNIWAYTTHHQHPQRPGFLLSLPNRRNPSLHPLPVFRIVYQLANIDLRSPVMFRFRSLVFEPCTPDMEWRA